MKSGVTSVTFKLSEPKAGESVGQILEKPHYFNGQTIEEDTTEIEIDGKKFTIAHSSGIGDIGAHTDIFLKIDAKETSVNTILALDTSYSMTSEFEDSTRYEHSINSIISFLSTKAKKLNLGIMEYGESWAITQDIIKADKVTKKKRKELEKELKGIKHKGKAALGTALNGALEVFNVKNLKDIRTVMILSDGADEIGPNPLVVARKLADRGIYIYPFYLGKESDSKSLKIFNRIAEISRTSLFSLHNAVEEEKRRLIRLSLSETDQEEENEDKKKGKKPDRSKDEDKKDGEPEKDEPEVPSGSELLTQKITELSTGPVFILRQGGKTLESAGEQGDVQVIKAGTVAEGSESNKPAHPEFRRTPNIFNAIKRFIEWLKKLIW